MTRRHCLFAIFVLFAGLAGTVSADRAPEPSPNPSIRLAFTGDLVGQLFSCRH